MSTVIEPIQKIQRAGKSNRKKPAGNATNDLVFSSHQGTNDQVFPYILSLYVRPKSLVADVTYGKGVFWRRVPKEAFQILKTDLATGTDCRELPYKNESIDCVVFDPPYMHTPIIKITKVIIETINRNPTKNIMKLSWTCTSLPPKKRFGFLSLAVSILSSVKTRYVP
ncbi:MAG: hypothetical protein LBQ66_05315 [Planctomycetaceae bacterium]|jgi:hypothetical protein|nr:hypothetical protein [Planctomycetaceae bacterium]